MHSDDMSSFCIIRRSSIKSKQFGRNKQIGDAKIRDWCSNANSLVFLFRPSKSRRKSSDVGGTDENGKHLDGLFDDLYMGEFSGWLVWHVSRILGLGLVDMIITRYSVCSTQWGREDACYWFELGYDLWFLVLLLANFNLHWDMY